MLSRPNNPGALDTTMAFGDTDGISTSPQVKETELHIERERPYGIPVAI